jgi:uncharacterized protein
MSKVYFIDLRATPKESFSAKLVRLVNSAGLTDVVAERDLVALKLHFGELGNTAFIRPVYLRQIVQAVRAAGGSPFLTDANTLYAGTRSNAASHLTTAIQNGFAYAVVDAPLVIADGLRGKSEVAVPINRKRFEAVYVGKEIVESDALISVAHFKGHELAGFGGAIKNVGMGCASRKGKLAQHSGLSPKVTEKDCIGCGDCAERCANNAISLEDELACIDANTCIGCGECILICPNGAIQVQWNQSIPIFLENMVEYTEGVLKNKAGKALFINFITNVSPACDCYPANDAPIVRDIGVVAGTDPVALDQASVDLVNQEPALAGSCLTTNTAVGEDKFKGIYPKVAWEHQLVYAEKLGLGSRSYDLVKL